MLIGLFDLHDIVKGHNYNVLVLIKGTAMIGISKWVFLIYDDLFNLISHTHNYMKNHDFINIILFY